MLTPSVKTTLSRHDDALANEADRKYAEVRARALELGQYTCAYCGFASQPVLSQGHLTLEASGYLEVHHKDNDHHNNALDNLQPVCPFCHMVFHVGFAGQQQRGYLAFVPHLNQVEMNLLSNLMGVVLFRPAHPLQREAIKLSNLFQSLRADQFWGEGSSDLSVLSQALVFLQERQLYEQRERAFEHLLIVPRLEAFPKAIQFWSTHVWLGGEDWPAAWQRLFQVAQAGQE